MKTFRDCLIKQSLLRTIAHSEGVQKGTSNRRLTSPLRARGGMEPRSLSNHTCVCAGSSALSSEGRERPRKRRFSFVAQGCELGS